MNLYLTCLITTDFLLLLLVINEMVKSYKRQKSKNQKPMIKPIDFEKDIKLLDETIKNNLNYAENTLLKPLLGKHKDTFLKDEDLKNIVATITLNIMDDLSDNYKSYLTTLYFSDLETYIAKRVNDSILPLLVNFNSNKL